MRGCILPGIVDSDLVERDLEWVGLVRYGSLSDDRSGANNSSHPIRPFPSFALTAASTATSLSGPQPFQKFHLAIVLAHVVCVGACSRH